MLWRRSRRLGQQGQLLGQLVQLKRLTDVALYGGTLSVDSCLQLPGKLLLRVSVNIIICITKAAVKLEGGDGLICVMMVGGAVGGGDDRGGHARVP